jgi:hypothetical protein
MKKKKDGNSIALKSNSELYFAFKNTNFLCDSIKKRKLKMTQREKDCNLLDAAKIRETRN